MTRWSSANCGFAVLLSVRNNIYECFHTFLHPAKKHNHLGSYSGGMWLPASIKTNVVV